MAPRSCIAVLLLALSAGCASTRVGRLDTGHGAPLEYRPPSSSRPVQVSAEAFEEALTHWVLSTPLTLRSPRQGWLVRAAYPNDGEDARWQRLVKKSRGGVCKPGRLREDCLSLLDDGMGLGEWEKLGMALTLSLDPLKESIAKAVEKTLAPQLVYTLIVTGLVTWAVLAANPEPAFTKSAAIVSAILLIYLGVEVFLELVDACRELKRTTDRATTIEELERAGQRFADRGGPEVARVYVLAVTVAVSHGLTGGSAWMASRAASMLPRYSEAAAEAALELGIKLGNVGQVSQVAVIHGSVVVTLPDSAVSAVAMAALGAGEDLEDGPNGQLHHIISKRIADRLEKHQTLGGLYKARDPRFVARAAGKDAHNGYQAWHRAVDDEVVNWLEDRPAATPEQFEAKLREIYNRPEMRARFPNGF